MSLLKSRLANGSSLRCAEQYKLGLVAPNETFIVFPARCMLWQLDFECLLCDSFQTKSQEVMEDHVVDIHQPWVCDYCGDNLTSELEKYDCEESHQSEEDDIDEVDLETGSDSDYGSEESYDNFSDIDDNQNYNNDLHEQTEEPMLEYVDPEELHDVDMQKKEFIEPQTMFDPKQCSKIKSRKQLKRYGKYRFIFKSIVFKYKFKHMHCTTLNSFRKMNKGHTK